MYLGVSGGAAVFMSRLITRAPAGVPGQYRQYLWRIVAAPAFGGTDRDQPGRVSWSQSHCAGIATADGVALHKMHLPIDRVFKLERAAEAHAAMAANAQFGKIVPVV